MQCFFFVMFSRDGITTPSLSGSLSALQYAGLVAGVAVFLLVVFLMVLWLRRKAQKNKQQALYSRPRRSKSTIIPLLRWEVLPEQVEFKEEIGRGAFGKVFRGIYRESPGIGVFYKCRKQTVDFKEGRTVAIKVLQDKTDEDAKEQLLQEIEIMKSIGYHKNVVSMLGCWVNNDPIFLLLEYVPYGDLRHWLINKRKKKNYRRFYDDDCGKRPAADSMTNQPCITDESKLPKSNTTTDTESDIKHGSQELVSCNDSSRLDKAMGTDIQNVHFYENVSFENDDDKGKGSADHHVKSVGQSSVCVPGDSSEEDSSHRPEFSAKDVLCFAWQIAQGMSFLSSEGFVHRDLAARNILLGEDRKVKISDFGLMRQVDQEVYKLKKGKKIPYKWMAPEAIFESEYTTRSDVWSFGVLLWELCTMGGNPYPGINGKDLYGLIKAGYRMEKPDTCTDELFQLMLDCWKEDPRERPTFDQATKILEKMMMVGNTYLNLDLVDESKAYYKGHVGEEKTTDTDTEDGIVKNPQPPSPEN